DLELIETIRKIKEQDHPLIVSITGADNNLIQNFSDINLYLFTDEISLNHLDITSHISMIALMELILYQFIESSGTDTYHLVFR
ncbi:phosphosugar-binding protein, partial [Enterococcus faecium]|nr:phosphosugar-binding protein [Enterococcus faecium]